MCRNIGLVILVIVVFNTVYLSDGKRVLLLPILIRSHVVSLSAIGEELVRRGFVVDLLVVETLTLSPDLISNKSGISIIRYPNRISEVIDHEIITSQIIRSRMAGEKFDLLNQLSKVKASVQAECLNLLVGNDELMEEMTRYKYDIAIVDSVFFTKCLHLIPVRLGIPWITYTDIFNPWLAKVPWLPSFHSIKTARFFGKMTFLERLQNTAMSALFFCYPLMPDPPDEVLAVYRRYGAFSSLDDLVSRSSLFVITSDAVLDDPLPFLPNMIHAGGLTAKPVKSENLPPEFQNFVTSAKSGIVVVSFGAMTSVFLKPVAEKFLAAFSALPEFHFIWKLDNTDGLQMPKNVMAVDWLPQNELLAHPQMKLFITHCGNNGQFEAVFHGVPMIGFPLHGDQEHNAKRLSNKGYGIFMNLYDFTGELLLDNIREIVTNPDYRRRVRLASEIFRSARRSPAERVVDGIEHVLRFGSDHLRPAGSDLPLYQYLMLDILAFVFSLVAAIAILVRRFLLFLFRRLINGSKKSKAE